MSKNTAEVVIIGGGISGCATAYYLAKLGVTDIVVIEKDFLASGSTGRCGAGVRQQWGLKMNVLLSKESIKAYETLNEELDTGLDIEFKQEGYLMLAYTEKMVEQYKRNVALQKALGIEVELITSEEAREIVPYLNTEGLLAATFCPTDGHINPFITTNSYAEAARRLGVRILTFTEVTGIDVEKGRVVAVETTKGKIFTNRVLNAAGGYSREVAAMAGVKLPTHPERHQILVTEAVAPVQGPMVISLHHGIYCQQAPHGSFIMGFGDPNELKEHVITSTWHFLEEMAAKILPLLPPLAELRVVRQWAGLYNMSPDAQPILGEVPQLQGFYNAVGFSGHGFMLGPVTGRLMAELISGRQPHMDISPLSLERFEKGELLREPSVV
ncbi:MAG: FAD-binding oxidoreductase [Eubacteriales bacterium]|nr:FAD-binding oxidoreductase [Eubacteriales bacterium]MDD3073754.1 FAD-binding oxidoreductase [Eubacteriales bacterium]MDD4079022.1 FAD-binding oxidoreductase [Eubacteriales bacterium]